MKNRHRRKINRANRKQTRYDNRTSFWSSCSMVIGASVAAVVFLVRIFL